MINLFVSAMDAIGFAELSYSNKARVRCELAKELEAAGDYEAACAALGELWRDVGVRPLLDKLDEAIKPHVLLRVGTLTGWVGSSKQIAGAQESAKDLISESARLFEVGGWTKNGVEAQMELALCYWREGTFDEARIILQGAQHQLDSLLNESNAQSSKPLTSADAELKASLLLRRAVVEFKTSQFDEEYKLLLEAVPLVENTQNNVLKGKLHGELALTLRNLSEAEGVSGTHRTELLDRALIEYAASSFYFEEAHAHLGRAQALFVGLRDEGSRAQVDEALARLFLAEGRTDEAERSARAAVNVLGQGGETALLVEALITHGVSLARTDRVAEARQAFERAVEGAESAGDGESRGRAVLALIEEIGERLTLAELCRMYEQADQLLSVAQNEMRRRLVACIKRLTAKMQEMISLEQQRESSLIGEMVGEVSVDDSSSPREEAGAKLSLSERVHIYEAEIIKDALEKGNNSVNRAAELLGVSHQTLSRILHHRHKSLLSMKKPRKRRQVNLIQHHKVSRTQDA